MVRIATLENLAITHKPEQLLRHGKFEDKGAMEEWKERIKTLQTEWVGDVWGEAFESVGHRLELSFSSKRGKRSSKLLSCSGQLYELKNCSWKRRQKKEWVDQIEFHKIVNIKILGRLNPEGSTRLIFNYSQAQQSKNNQRRERRIGTTLNSQKISSRNFAYPKWNKCYSKQNISVIML